MPGMNSASSAAYGLLANSFYIYLFTTGALGLILSVLWIYLFKPELTKRGHPRFFTSKNSRADNLTLWADSSPKTRFLRLTFGLMWLFDGLFQMRPEMPGGFVQQVMDPALTNAPPWVISVAAPFADLWNAHPVSSAAFAGWLEVLIGLGLLLARGRKSKRLVLYISIIWCLSVFAIGNGFGIFYPGASWLTGAPPAVIIYCFVSILLLSSSQKNQWPERPKPTVYFLAAFLGIGAFLQALPTQGYWSSKGNSSMIADMAHAGQPWVISESLKLASQVASSDPFIFNLAMVLLPISAAVAILVYPQKRPMIYYVATVEFLGWWIGMDFGIFSSTSTDFNSGLPMIILALSLLKPVTFPPLNVSETDHSQREIELKAQEGSYTRYGNTIFSFSVITTVISLMIATYEIFTPASAAIAEVDSGGLKSLPPQTAPNFALTNYSGKQVGIRSLSGSPVVLTFFNPSCKSACITNIEELKHAAETEPYNPNLSMVLVNANPTATSPQLVKAFIAEHKLPQAGHWFFLTGTPGELQNVWNLYHETTTRASNGKLHFEHQFIFIGANGTEKLKLIDSNNPQLSQSYSALIKQALIQLG